VQTTKMRLVCCDGAHRKSEHFCSARGSSWCIIMYLAYRHRLTYRTASQWPARRDSHPIPSLRRN